jgi:hypothetical protein
MSHKCPGLNCDQQVPADQLACRSHWFSLPRDLRNRVWSAWRAGDQTRHAAAVRDAISHLQAIEHE